MNASTCKDLKFWCRIHPFGIGTPQAMQWTTLQEHNSPNSVTIVEIKPLYVPNKPFGARPIV